MRSSEAVPTLFATTKEELYHKRVNHLCHRIKQIKSCASLISNIPKENLTKWEKEADQLLLKQHSNEQVIAIETVVEQFRERHIQKLLRLSTGEINALLGFSSEKDKNSKLVKHELGVADLQVKSYCKWDQKNGRNFYTFTVSKDENDPLKSPDAPYIGDLISQFKKMVKDEKATLLMPLLQCGTYLGQYVSTALIKAISVQWDLEKAHLVLVEINLEKKCIEVHDAKKRWILYPDALIAVAAELKFNYEPAKHYHGYEIQQDHALCGYFIYEFCKSILDKGDSSECKHVKLNDNDYVTKLDYIRPRLPNWGKEETIEKDPEWMSEVVVIETPSLSS